jgi:oligoribonuclease (3'-5' exoribonuclease)
VATAAKRQNMVWLDLELTNLPKVLIVLTFPFV